jgi:integrase
MNSKKQATDQFAGLTQTIGELATAIKDSRSNDATSEITALLQQTCAMVQVGMGFVQSCFAAQMDAAGQPAMPQTVNIAANVFPAGIGVVPPQMNEQSRIGEISPVSAGPTATFAEAAAVYLEVYKKDKVRKCTFKQYRDRLKIVTELVVDGRIFGDYRLSEVTTTISQKAFNQITHYSETVVKDCRMLTKAVFKIAVKDKVIVSNPLEDVQIRFEKQKEKYSWTKDERRIIMEFAENYPRFGLAMYVLLATGVRGGEIRALKASDYVLGERCFHISGAVKCEEELGEPKNSEKRDVYIYKEFAVFIEKRLKKLQPDDYILPSEAGSFVTRGRFQKRYNLFFERLQKKNPDIPRYSPHSTRHTWITLMQADGWPVEIVAQMAGHGDVKITKKYTHLKNSRILKNAVEQFEEKLHQS